MLGSDLLLKMLTMHQVEHIFGVPGDTSMSFYDALYDCKSIRHIMCRDERSAGFMADAYARVSQKPGVTEAPSGAGATYVLPAAVESDGSTIPLVVLASDTARTSEDRAAITALEQRDVFLPVTRYSRRVGLPQMIPQTVRMAFRSATAGRMGAAHVALPEDVLSGVVDDSVAEECLYAQEEYSTYPAHRVRPPSERVGEVAGLLRSAERPLILAGGGVLLSGAEEQLRKLVDEESIGVVTTMDGKGALPEDHPLALGAIGSNGGKKASNRAISEADMVLAVGTQLSSTSTFGGKLLSHRPKMVHVDLDAEKPGNNVPVSLAVQADARLFLADLVEVMREMKGGDSAPSGWVIQRKREVVQEIEAVDALVSEHPGMLHPAQLLRVFRENLPEEATLVCDPGTPTPYIMAYYPARRAGKYIFAARSQGGLGYALPAALGVHMVRPESPVVALMGDGSLGMTIGELETLVREGDNIVLIHTRNDTYGWIKQLQNLYYGRRYFSVDFSRDVDYVAAARAFGAKAKRAESVEEFEEALREALTGGVTFIEVPTLPETEATPPVAPWLRDESVPEEQRQRRSY